MLPLYAEVSARGFTMSKLAAYPAPRLNSCCADFVNSFVVDNRGELYRCWNHVGNPKYSSGNVNDLSNEFGKNYLSWIQWNPIRHPKCRECTCLPVCIGGCPDAMRNSDDGQPVCGTVKYNLDQVLNHYYEQLKGAVIWWNFWSNLQREWEFHLSVFPLKFVSRMETSPVFASETSTQWKSLTAGNNSLIESTEASAVAPGRLLTRRTCKNFLEEFAMKFLVKPVKNKDVSWLCIPIKVCIPAVTLRK